jgi:hypothetical protein
MPNDLLPTARQLADRIKLEIMEDVCSGIIPVSMERFSDLHDYVDANCYGGTEALLDKLDDAAPATDEGHRAALDSMCDLMNEAMEFVDVWIKAGGIECALLAKK